MNFFSWPSFLFYVCIFPPYQTYLIFEDEASKWGLGNPRTPGKVGVARPSKVCTYLVTGGITDPQPIFVHHNTTSLLVPNASGIVELQVGQRLDIYCSTGFTWPYLNFTKITAECVEGSYFLAKEKVVNFKSFSCTKNLRYTTRSTNQTCSGGAELFEVGFAVAPRRFITVMDVCHDKFNQATRYVHHKMDQSAMGFQRSVPRTSFVGRNFYNGKDVNAIYSQIQQKLTFDSILRKDSSEYFNPNKQIFLSRGHICAKSDQIYSTAQRATFNFINVAPQWQIFNAGNWQRIEDGVRRFVSDQKISVECYTGTWGVATLPDVNGMQQELYLDFDENNNGLIPVPKLYFRVVIEPATKKGIALVGVNNPHVTLQEILEEYVICQDISEVITWIKWKRDNILQGYSYACEVNAFRAAVDHLPKFNVEGLLY